MILSTEALISLLGVLVSLPPALIILWNICKRRRVGWVEASGMYIQLHIHIGGTHHIDPSVLGELIDHGRRRPEIRPEPRYNTNNVVVLF